MSREVTPLWEIIASNGLQTGPFGSQLKASEYTKSGIPVVMPKDIFNGEIVTDEIARVPETKAKELEKHRIVTGDIIFPRRGDLGRIGVAKKENEGWLCGTGCLRARLKDRVDPGYIHQYVQLAVVKKWLERNALGQTMLNLNTDIISNLPVHLAPFKEQTVIANLLSTWDEAIEKTERLIQAKERRFQWLLRDTMSDSAKGNINNGRKKVAIGSFLTESRIPDTVNDPNKRLTVRLHLKGVEARDVRGTESSDATAYFIRKSGQLVYGKQNIFRGAVGIIPPELDGYASTQDIPAFDIDKTVDPGWLLFLFSCPGFYKKLEIYASGSGSKRLHPKDLFKISVSVPSLEEQKSFAERLYIARKEINLLEQLAERYKTQKRGLMQKLLTGQWRIKFEKEVA